MKAYDKYLNEEKDRLVEVHTDWLKEVDLNLNFLNEERGISERKLLETTEIFIERFERLENQFKNLAELVVELEINKEKPIELKINNEKFAESSVKYSEKGIVIDRMKGIIK